MKEKNIVVLDEDEDLNNLTGYIDCRFPFHDFHYNNIFIDDLDKFYEACEINGLSYNYEDIIVRPKGDHIILFWNRHDKRTAVYIENEYLKIKLKKYYLNEEKGE